MRFLYLLFFSIYITNAFAADHDSVLDSVKNVYLDLPPVEYAEKLREIGIQYKNTLKYSLSLVFLDEAYRVFVEENDSLGRAATLNNLGVTNRLLGDDEKSLQNFHDAININKKLADNIGLAKNYLNLGNFYFVKEYYDDALFYFEKVLEVADNKSLVAKMHVSMANIYARENEKYSNSDKAVDYYLKALNLFTEQNDFQQMGAVFNNLAIHYKNNGYVETALSYYHKTLELNLSKGNVKNLTATYLNIGNLYFEDLNRPLIAKDYYLKGIDLAKGSGNPNLYLDYLSNLLKVKIALNENEDNLSMFDELIVMRDSVYNIEKEKHLDELYTYYQSEQRTEQLKQQLEINKANSKTNQLLIVLLFFVFVTLVSVSLYIFSKLKYNKSLREKEDRLHSEELEKVKKEYEIEALNVLISGQENERRRIAEDLHDRLGSKLAAVKLMFASKNDKAKNSIPKILSEIIHEMREISHNLHSGILYKYGLKEALDDFLSNFEDSGEYEVFFECEDFHPRLDKKIEKNIFYIIQEFLANTIKHAKASKISIQIIKYPDQNLNIIYEDNGKGFDFYDINTKESGIGFKNIKARLSGINGKLMVDSKIGVGSTFIIDVENIGSNTIEKHSEKM